MLFIAQVVLYLLAAVIAVNVLYVLIFSLASLWPAKKQYAPLKKYNRFAVLIPAFKGDEVILSTMFSSFRQDYPRDKYDIVIIADSLKSYTVGEMKLHPVKVIEVQFENSTKAKSLNAAIDYLNADDYDYAVVLDIDNIMEEDFLHKLNLRLQNNEIIIQAHRVAKNMDTAFAILDAVSEEINNHIFRKGHYNLGLSAALIGSGMAMKYDAFVKFMREAKAIGGFDKELEINLISEGIKIDYDHDNLIFDEKVQKSEVFKNQRRRWLSAQYKFLYKNFRRAVVRSLKDKNFDLFDKILQFSLLPRIILLGFLTFFSALYLIGLKEFYFFFILFVAYGLAMLIAIPAKFYSFKNLIAMLYLPKAFWLMFLTFFKLKGADKKFIHTPHSITHADDNK